MMTKDRDFKRLVRARADRSGESYQRSRQAMRPDTVDSWKELDEVVDEASPWTDEEQSAGTAIAELALRMADGKPTMPGPPWTQELSELVRAMVDANERARASEATATDTLRAETLRGDVERLAAELHRAQPLSTPDEYLSVRIGGRLRVALAARARCRALLELNPRDPVAREAHDKLSVLAVQVLDAETQ
jgi:hypothetical protein